MGKKWFQKEKTIGGKEPLINKSPIVKNSPSKTKQTYLLLSFLFRFSFLSLLRCHFQRI